MRSSNGIHITQIYLKFSPAPATYIHSINSNMLWFPVTNRSYTAGIFIAYEYSNNVFRSRIHIIWTDGVIMKYTLSTYRLCRRKLVTNWSTTYLGVRVHDFISVNLEINNVTWYCINLVQVHVHQFKVMENVGQLL